MWFKKAIFAACALLAASSAFAQGTQFPAGTVWGNDTAAQRPGKVNTITSLLDRALGSTRGSIIERGAGGWAIVGPGATAGFPYVTNGAGADPSYQRLGLVGGGTNANLSATGGASQFLRQNSAGATIDVVQPNFTDLAGRGTLAQLPQGIANSIFINPTGSTANMQNVAVPACANDGAHALVYVNASGLACATLTTGGTVTSVTCGGVAITISGTCPPKYGLVNHSLAVSAAGSALTIALKDSAGSDPSATSPVTGDFRSATGTTGSWVQRSVTAANSLVISSGSTMGVTSSTAFRIWVVLFDDAGTMRLGAINCSTSTQIFALDEAIPVSSTAEGGAGAADSAGVFYTGTAVTSKSFLIVGYVEWSSTGLTAGTWTTTNLNFVQSFGAGIKKPGDVIQGPIYSTTSSATTVTNSTTQTQSALQGTITPTSAANLIRVNAGGNLAQNNSSAGAAANTQLSRGTGPTLIGNFTSNYSQGGVSIGSVSMLAIDKPNTASSQQYSAYVWCNAATNCTAIFPNSTLAIMTLEEIQG